MQPFVCFLGSFLRTTLLKICSVWGNDLRGHVSFVFVGFNPHLFMPVRFESWAADVTPLSAMLSDLQISVMCKTSGTADGRGMFTWL